jgi:hypothetical protein
MPQSQDMGGMLVQGRVHEELAAFHLLLQPLQLPGLDGRQWFGGRLNHDSSLKLRRIESPEDR